MPFVLHTIVLCFVKIHKIVITIFIVKFGAFIVRFTILIVKFTTSNVKFAISIIVKFTIAIVKFTIFIVKFTIFIVKFFGRLHCAEPQVGGGGRIPLSEVLMQFLASVLLALKH